METITPAYRFLSFSLWFSACNWGGVRGGSLHSVADSSSHIQSVLFVFGFVFFFSVFMTLRFCACAACIMSVTILSEGAFRGDS